GGISMGALFHQFIGTPVSINSVEILEKSIEQSLELQPCVVQVDVVINRKKLEELNTEFDYVSLGGDMLNVNIITEFNETKAYIKMEYVDELKYPLMYIENIE
ncbi:MAG: dihydroneopterin aldolase family protein, partial [Methanobacteriaceae archaeon]|nr:dihydroneopterin aldolase family protein [Methanobacteriaceae archaeon]